VPRPGALERRSATPILPQKWGCDIGTIGYRPGTSAADYGIVGTADSLNQRASVAQKMTEDGWAYQISIRGGRRTATIPRFTLAMWSVGTGTAPDALIGRTNASSAGTYMLDRTDGTSYTLALQTAARLFNT
jgi:hypothetical protein